MDAAGSSGKSAVSGPLCVCNVLCDVESRGFPARSGENQRVHLCNAGYYNSKLSVDSARNHDADHVAGHGFGARRSDFVRTSGERENDGVSRRFLFAAKFFCKKRKKYLTNDLGFGILLKLSLRDRRKTEKFDLERLDSSKKNLKKVLDKCFWF